MPVTYGKGPTWLKDGQVLIGRGVKPPEQPEDDSEKSKVEEASGE